MKPSAAAARSFWNHLPLGPGVELLAHDANGLAALSKPAGVLSHPNGRSSDPRALLTAGYTLDGECYAWTPTGATAPVRLWLLNRLDSATSGVILVAADGALATAVRGLFKHRHVRKTYLALVFGRPVRKSDLWRDRLKIEKAGGQVRTDTGGRLPAETQMAVLASDSRSHPPLTLLRLEPHTGRSHQLRVQCASRHLPIVGDMTYGDFQKNRDFVRAGGSDRLFLHSAETAFDYEWAGRSHHFAASAPPPPEFRL